MKIILATGIFYPDIGGPALYSRKLAEQFSKNGAEVLVFTYGNKFPISEQFRIFGVSRFWPYGLRQLIYFLKLLRHVKKSDAIIAFDSLGAGLPAILAGKLSGKKVIIRMGGDFLWEKFIESGNARVTMEEFYTKNLHKNYPILFRLIKFVLQNSRWIIFTTEFQSEIFSLNYGLRSDRVIVIGNVFSGGDGSDAGGRKKLDKDSGSFKAPRVILWAGRFIKLKNLFLLLNVFKRLSAGNPDLVLKLIGSGPELEKLKTESKKLKVEDRVLFPGSLDEDSLAEEIEKSYLCVLPSLSEISPNFALKCLGLKKPVIITQETGMRKEFPGLMYADPKKEESFYQAILRLLDENSYDNYLKLICDIKKKKTWEDLSREYREIFIK